MSPDEIAETLAQARYDERLTVRTVGARLGVVPSAVNGWELGRRRPSLDNLTAWADSLGYEVALIPKKETRC